jgi:hypothetical protein
MRTPHGRYAAVEWDERHAILTPRFAPKKFICEDESTQEVIRMTYRDDRLRGVR